MSIEELGPEPRVEDLRVASFRPLLSPQEVRRANPPTERGLAAVDAGRNAIRSTLDSEILGNRLIVVTGPCSVHNVDQSLEYTAWLREKRAAYSNELELLQRVYFEKPRTTVGWEGLVMDPHLDESFDINYGLMAAGKLLRDTTDQGVPVATEWLDTDTPEYYGGFISWGAIGARTTESPLHRRLASGLSSPIGFKNGTGGNIQLAVDAVIAASYEHRFIGTKEDGRRAIVATKGNPDCHIVLRGGSNGPNYSPDKIEEAAVALERAHLAKKVMIDASHGNSSKDYRNQLPVVREIARQVSDGNNTIMGVMVESNLIEGKQDFKPGGPFEYGVSITDGCVNLDETDLMFQILADAVQSRRSKSSIM